MLTDNFTQTKAFFFFFKLLVWFKKQLATYNSVAVSVGQQEISSVPPRNREPVSTALK